MSRKIFIMCAALVILAALSAVEQIMVQRVTRIALAQTQSILADIREEDFASAHEKAHALDRTWDKQASRLEILVDHRSTDEVRYALSRLLAALESEDRAAALIYAGELEGGIEHVYERQELSVQNIL